MSYRFERPIYDKEGIDLKIAQTEQQIEIHNDLLKVVDTELEKAHLTVTESKSIKESIQKKISDLNTSLLKINAENVVEKNKQHLLEINEQFYEAYSSLISDLQYLNQRGFLGDKVLETKLAAIKLRLINNYQSKINFENTKGVDVTFGVDLKQGKSYGVVVEVVDENVVKVLVNGEFQLWESNSCVESDKTLNELPSDLNVAYEETNFLMNKIVLNTNVKVRLGDYVDGGVVFQKSQNTFLLLKCNDVASMLKSEISNYNKIDIPKEGGFRLPLVAELIQIKIFCKNRGVDLRGVYWSKEKEGKLIKCVDMDVSVNEPILLDVKKEGKWVLVKEV